MRVKVVAKGTLRSIHQPLVRDAGLRRDYRRRLWRFLKVHRRPGLVLFYLFHMTMHYHARYLATNMASRELQLVNVF